jgi:hypothetical protein
MFKHHPLSSGPGYAFTSDRRFSEKQKNRKDTRNALPAKGNGYPQTERVKKH